MKRKEKKGERIVNKKKEKDFYIHVVSCVVYVVSVTRFEYTYTWQ